MLFATATTIPSSLQSVSTSTKWTELWISILGGLMVVFIPFVLKYFNAKFSTITETAEKVRKHHKSNKKRLNKINKAQKQFANNLTDLTTILARYEESAERERKLQIRDRRSRGSSEDTEDFI